MVHNRATPPSLFVRLNGYDVRLSSDSASNRTRSASTTLIAATRILGGRYAMSPATHHSSRRALRRRRLPAAAVAPTRRSHNFLPLMSGRRIWDGHTAVTSRRARNPLAPLAAQPGDVHLSFDMSVY